MKGKKELTEKDKIKFNLQEGKKSVQLSKELIEQNKKKNLRKYLLINTQVNPAVTCAIKPQNYGNIKSAIKQQMGSPQKQSSDLHSSSMPNSPNGNNRIRGVHHQQDGGFKLFPANEKENKYIANLSSSMRRLERSRTSLKSNKILKQVSINIQEESTSNSAFNTISSYLTASLLNNPKQKRIKTADLSSLLESKSNLLDNSNSISNLKFHHLKQQASPLIYSADTLSSFKFNQKSYNNSDDSSVNSSSNISTIDKQSKFAKHKGCIRQSEDSMSPLITEKRKHEIIYVEEEQAQEVPIIKRSDTKKISNGMEFLTVANHSKLKYRNASIKTPFVKNKRMPELAHHGGAVSTDFNFCQAKEIILNGDSDNFLKTNRSNSKAERDKGMRKSQDKKSTIILPENQTWNYFSDKYLRYLFTGKVHKYKDASICKDKNLSNSIIGYSCNVNKGIMRDYNEDNIVCIINLAKPKSKILEVGAEWPSVSYFAVFDGHGGNSVSEWLAENLHFYIVSQTSFPKDIHLAIKQGFKEAEENLLIKLSNNLLSTESKSKQKSSSGFASAQDKKHDSAGSCALVVLIIDSACYVANLGDSRALLAKNNFMEYYTITKDHKPENPDEKRRIEENGGKLWKQNRQDKSCPFRVIPGGLSVSHKLL